MRSFKTLVLGLFALMSAAFAATEALAVGNACSVTGATGASIGNYDPFAPSSINNLPVNLTLTRYTSTGGKKTQQVDFYFVQPNGSPAYQILYNGVNVLYTLPTTHALDYNSPPSGTVGYNFQGAASPDTVTLPFVITFPTGADVSAGETITFDIIYICNGTGNLDNIDTPTTLAGAISLTVHVLSGIQASYAGPALDFGDITTVTSAQAPTHSVTGNISVKSSGPYSIQVTSTAPDKFRMTYTGGSTSNATPTQYVPYTVTLKGQTLSNASPTFTTVTCSKATLAGVSLPITATLAGGADGGGAGKVPGGVFSDNLTVTISPLVSTAPGQVTCP